MKPQEPPSNRPKSSLLALPKPAVSDMRGKNAARAAPMLALAAISCCSAWRISARRVSRSDGKPAGTAPNSGCSEAIGTVANSAVDAGGVPTQLSKLNICTRIEGSPTSGNQKTINIDGNILYANADKLAPAAPADAGVLGLVAGYIKIVPRARVVEDGPVGNPRVTGFANRAVAEDGAYANGATLDTLSVHATLMSFNTIKIDSYDTRPKGQFRLLGGYIAQVGSRFGTAVGGTGVNAFNVATGFERILSYDKRVANQPPPFFPGTGQSYEVISYQRLLAPLQP